MAFFGRMMDRWAEDESPELDGVFRSLYGPLVRLGFLFPSWTRKQRLKTVLHLFWLIFVNGFHLPLLTKSAILVLDNTMLCSLVLHYWVLMVCLVSATILFQVNRKNFVRFHRTFLGDLCTYCSGRIYDDDAVKSIHKRLDEESRRMAAFPLGLVAIEAFAIILVPYVKNVNKGVAYEPSGMSMTLPVPAWYPYETHRGLSHAVTVALQIAIPATVVPTAICALLLVYHALKKIRFEYEVLGYSLSTLLDRSYRLYINKHPERLRHEIDNFDRTYQYYIGLCLKDCITHHVKISQMTRDFEEMTSWLIALAFLAGMFGIGLALINILSLWEQSDYENVTVFGILLISETMNMFIISAVGEIVTAADENLRNQVYFVDWYKLNVRNRKVLHIFQTRVTEPVLLKAGIIIDIRLETFTGIMNSAYSVFNLMEVA